jgi:hypothetical protein
MQTHGLLVLLLPICPKGMGFAPTLGALRGQS